MEVPIDRETVTKLLLKVEQGVHRDGWDQDAWIGILYWVRPGVLALANSRIPVVENIGAWVDYLGKKFLADSDYAKALGEDIDHRFFGWAAVTEAWGIDQTPEQARERYASSDPSIASRPDRVEMRNIHAVDIYARHYMIVRQRGQKPVDWVNEPGLRELAGRVPQGLTNMVLASVRQNPVFADRLLDLETLFIPTIEESFDAHDFRKKMEHPPEE